MTARYVFPVAGIEGMDAHVQGSLQYQSSVWSDLRTLERGILGKQRAYGVTDFSAGVEKNGITAEFFVDNAFDIRGDVYNYAECTEAVCGPIAVYHVPNRPRTFGLRFGQRF
jgi:outer membrane receptor protein involved in Fe transport